MLKRMIVMLAATMMIVAALGFVKFKQIQTAVAQGAAFQPPPEAVTTIVAGQEEWPATLTEIGTVELWCQSRTDDRRWRLPYHRQAHTARRAVSKHVNQTCR